MENENKSTKINKHGQQKQLSHVTRNVSSGVYDQVTQSCRLSYRD